MKSLTEQLDCARRLVTARRAQRTKAEKIGNVAVIRAQYELDCAESIVETLYQLRSQGVKNTTMCGRADDTTNHSDR